MSLAEDIAETLAEGQELWLETATDTCRVTRTAVDGDDEFVAREIDDETLQYPEQGRVLIYEGPCRIQIKADINSNVVEITAGDREWTYLTAQLQVPVHTPESAQGDVNAIEADHIAEITVSPYSPALVGSLFNLQAPYRKSHAVYQRIRAREVVS